MLKFAGGSSVLWGWGLLEKGIPGFWQQRKRDSFSVPCSTIAAEAQRWPSSLLGLCLYPKLQECREGSNFSLTNLICDELRLSPA